MSQKIPLQEKILQGKITLTDFALFPSSTPINIKINKAEIEITDT